MSENVLDRILGKRPEGSVDGPRPGVRPSASAAAATPARSDPRGEQSSIDAATAPHAPSSSHDPYFPNTPHDPDAFEDHGAFGWLRGVKERSLMLELRLRTGQILALGYAWIDSIDFDPSDGITLHAGGGGRTIRIFGRNLNAEVRPGVRLFHGLTKHRVPWIQEADHATIVAAPQHAAVVERLEW